MPNFGIREILAQRKENTAKASNVVRVDFRRDFEWAARKLALDCLDEGIAEREAMIKKLRDEITGLQIRRGLL
jgi:hypothetical protein